MEKVKQGQKNIWQRFVAFFDKYYALFYAPIIVAILYIFALWQEDVYPFGNKYTAASYDLSAQICPFIEHLFDVFDGKSKLTFSYAIVGGADVTGTFLYFFISPFSFLFLIFGDGKVAHASSIVMLCKLATIAVSGAWFAKKIFKGIPDYLCVAIGVTYAYCGYTFVASTYINWVDFLIYLPFCAGAFKRFVKTGKFLAFSILTACCVYTCFSIACFSMFIVFPALIAYALLCVEKEKKKKFITYLCLSFAVALIMALPVLLPALGAYSVSGRGGGLFDNLWKGFTGNTPSGAFNSSTFVDSYSESLYRKWSYILSDSIFVVLTVVWFWRKGLKDRFAQFMLIAGALTLIPTVVDESMNLLNMGSYMSYALRFGFLNALYFLGGACLCLENLCYKPFTAIDGERLIEGILVEEELPVEKKDAVEEISENAKGTENSAEVENSGGRYAWKEVLSGSFWKKNYKTLLWAGALTVLAALATGFLIWFGDGDNYKRFMDKLGSDASGFAASFAHSLGGLDVVAVLFLLVGVVTIVGCFLVDMKKVSPRLLSVLLIFVVGAQVLFYNQQMVVGNRSTQHERLGNYQTLTEELLERDDGYYRIADYNDTMTACSPFTAGSNSFSVFSSVIDADNFVTYQLFGFKGNGKNSYKSGHSLDKYNRSDEFGYAFLGYKYLVSDNSVRKKPSTNEAESQTIKDLSYVKPVPVYDEEGNVLMEGGKEVQLSKGDLYVYENELVFPLGYTVQGGEGFKFVKENISNSSYRKENLKALYQYLRGQPCSGNYVDVAAVRELHDELQDRAADVNVEAGKITANVNAEAGENLLLSFVAVKGYSVTINGKKAKLVDNDLKFLLVELEEGENEVVFTYSSPYVKQSAVGVVGAIVLLCAVAFVVKKTKWVEKLSPVVSWVGVLLAVAVVAFFMIFPTGVFLSKVVRLI